MKSLLTLAAVLVAWALLVPTLLVPAAAAQNEQVPDGKTLFTDVHKCSMCHAVPAAGIEAKTQSEKMKGGDLGGRIERELEEIAAYVRKQADLDGKSHKKPFKGTDEELQAIVDWLGSLEAQQ